MANLSAVIDDDLKQKLEVIAGREHRSISNVVSIILSKGVTTYEENSRKNRQLATAN